MVSSSMMAALLDETVHIKCSAKDGNPDQHNITLFKNNIQLMASIQSNSLTYSAKGAFGVYTCLVESLYTTATESLFLQEKGTQFKHQLLPSFPVQLVIVHAYATNCNSKYTSSTANIQLVLNMGMGVTNALCKHLSLVSDHDSYIVGLVVL